ncbi:MAG: hypothetical protein PHO37_07265 [Kiritimatiellae bacterium]|nr:hypothetical protein [Kiritimatiellia bacterium]
MAIIESIKESVKVDDFAEPGAFNKWMTGAIAVAALFCVASLFFLISVEGCRKGLSAKNNDAQTGPTNQLAAADAPELLKPVRPAPATFPANSNLPAGRESLTSGAIDLKRFDPKKELIRFHDSRVWFASDHDKGATENTHLIHRAIEIPLKRLVNLVEQKGGKLKIQAAYRARYNPETTHLENSLHREGRALRMTSDNLDLSELGKLAWQAGFDYVLYEVPANGGAHLHCSVKRLPTK